MAQISKTFRIFVSSTFSDLKEERNALQQHVFPKLRELCMQHGCRFQAIDLRWGVSEEASQDQQTMKICLEEIRRCQRVSARPNFIVLLGDRYGWCPLPYEIPVDEFELIIQYVLNAGERELLTHWYTRNDNAVPPVYDLQPRKGEFTDSVQWKPVEKHLRSILLAAIQDLPLDPDKRLKYTTSATEQEIIQGALQIQNASEHVFGFFRSIVVPSEDETACPLKDAPLDQRFREFVNLSSEGNLDHEVYAQLDGLKERLCRQLPGNISNYKAKWAGSGITIGHIEKLCEDVYDSLSLIILAEIAQFEEIAPLEREKVHHEAFKEDRTKIFTGRSAILRTIAEYIKGTDHHPLAILGASGTGKTALLAQAVENVCADHPDAEVVFRFIGVTPESSDGRSLLASLCQEISRLYQAGTPNISADYRKLVKDFPKRLALATRKEPLVIILDALDQLSYSYNARNLTWLPVELPESVRIIVSSLPNESKSALERKVPIENIIELIPMSKREGQDLLGSWLKDAGRTLRTHQQSEILNKFDCCGLPLYLKLAFETAKQWKSYTDTSQTVLNPGIEGIITDLFTQFSQAENHGEMIVSRSLGYLAASKNGLAEDELLDVLSWDQELFIDFIKRAHHEPPEKKLPVVLWARLHYDLAPYLAERLADEQILFSFYHKKFAEMATSKFLSGQEKNARHSILRSYFREKGVRNPRTLSELPFHETELELHEEVEETLTNLVFLTSKAKIQNIYNLLEDFEYALKTMKFSNPLFTAVYYTLKGFAHLIFITPSSLPNQLKLQLAKEEYELLVKKAEQSQYETQNKESFLLITPDRSWNSGIGHFGPPNSCKFSSDGRYICSAGDDGLVIIWDIEGIHPPRMFSHEEDVFNIARFSPDGSLIAAGGDNGMITIWDRFSGQIVTVLEDHRFYVLVLVWSPDGRFLASAGGMPARGDYEIRIWRVSDWSPYAKYTGAGQPVAVMAFSRDSRFLASAGRFSEALHIYDLEYKKESLSSSVGVNIRAICFHPNGESLYTFTTSLEQRCAKTGECIKRFNLALPEDTSNVIISLNFNETGEQLYCDLYLQEQFHRLTIYSSGSELLKQISLPVEGKLMDFDLVSHHVVLLKEQQFEIRNLMTFELIKQFDVYSGKTADFSAVALSGNGKRVLFSEGIMGINDYFLYDREIHQQAQKLEITLSDPSFITLKGHVKTGKHGKRWIINSHLVEIKDGVTRKIEYKPISSGSHDGVHISNDEHKLIRESDAYLFEIGSVDRDDFTGIPAAFALKMVLRYSIDESEFAKLSQKEREGQKVRRIFMPNFPIVSFDDNDERVLIGADTGEVYIFSLIKNFGFCGYPKLESGISTAAWTKDGKHVVCATEHGTIAIAQVPETFQDSIIGNWFYLLRDHFSKVVHMGTVNYKGSEFLVSIDENHNIVVAEINTGTVKTRILTPIQILSLSTGHNSVKCILAGQFEPANLMLHELIL